MPKRKYVFTDKRKGEYIFLKQCQNSNNRVRCLTCDSKFLMEHGGRYDIENHMQSEKFKWLTLQNDPTWEEMEAASTIIVVSIVPNSINVVNVDQI